MVFIALQALIKLNLCKVIVGFNLILKGGDMENVLNFILHILSSDDV